jgi:hypothetical protein
LAAAATATAQPPPAPETPKVAPLIAPANDGTFLLTIFLRHDELKPLGKINQELKEQDW